MIQRLDPVTGLSTMSLEDEEDDEGEKKTRPSPEELRLKALREREEKQQRYDEARARILGTTSGTSSPGTVTPPAASENGKPNRGKGRGRDSGRQDRGPDSQSGSNELFDPNYTPKPGGITIQKRSGEATRSGRSTPRDEEQVIRAPQGPDGSGRGGFGFVKRGGKKT